MPPIPEAALESFRAHLAGSKRILALCGAGLSAASGLPTFRGAGGYWRTHYAIHLGTPASFAKNPGLVWQFYSYRRHMALRARPNKGHLALAKLAEVRGSGFLTITQNVDGLAVRAHHPPEQLEMLHGSLDTVRCSSPTCTYVEHNNVQDPIVPALAIPTADSAGQPVELDISSADIPLRDVPASDLPHCPQCRTALLRPGVVWFGETLPKDTLKRVDAWMDDPADIDLMLVVGTSAEVSPAAAYIYDARDRGARIAVINTEPPDSAYSQLEEGDWFFQGDAGQVLPLILRDVIGDLPDADGA